MPTPQQWASSLLHRLGIHQTPGAVQALVGWQRAEGGHWNNDARYNPLNTTQPEPGAGNTGSQGNIKAYRSWDQGLDATVRTLRNGRYGGILSALRAGDPSRVASAIGQSPWGTSGGLARSAILGTPSIHGARPIAGARAASSDGGGLASSLQGSVTPGQVTGGGFDPGSPTDVSSLADLLSKPQPQAPQLPAAPFSTSKYLHMGQSPVVTPQAPQGGLEDALAALQSSGQELPQTSVSGAQTSVSGSVPTAHSASTGKGGSGRTPTARAGPIIGTPYTGTHTLGNWQSDNAVDIKVPEGTPMVSLQDGVVVKVRHHPQDGSRFAGDQITVRGANGNEYFYAHGHASVRPGQRISKGQSLGVTGSANGIAHLHFGQMRGDPRQHVRSR